MFKKQGKKKKNKIRHRSLCCTPEIQHCKLTLLQLKTKVQTMVYKQMNAYQKDTPEKARIIIPHQKNLQEIEEMI